MVICILRDTPSAAPRNWVCALIADVANDRAIEAQEASERLAGMQTFEGRSVVERVIARTGAETGSLVIAASGGEAQFAGLGFPVIPYTEGGGDNGLGGVLAGLDWTAKHVREASWVAAFAADAPFVPWGLVDSFMKVVSETGAEIVIPTAGGERRLPWGFWSVGCRRRLRRFLRQHGAAALIDGRSPFRIGDLTVDAVATDPFRRLG